MSRLDETGTPAAALVTIKPMMILQRITLGVMVMLLLASCTDNRADQTIEANYVLAGTEVAQLQATSTVQAARLQTTVDFAQTRSALAATQSGFLQATLSSRGTPESYLQDFQERMLNFQTPTPSATPTVTPDDQTTATSGTPETVSPTPASSAQTSSGDLGITPLAAFATDTPTPRPTPDPNNAQLTQLTNSQLGTTIGNDDCVSTPQTTFPTDTTEIYVSVRVENAPENTQFVSRWNLRGEEVVRFEYTPDFAIDGRCIWFFIDETDVEFVPGNWSVVLDVNGQPATDPLEFIMTEPDGA